MVRSQSQVGTFIAGNPSGHTDVAGGLSRPVMARTGSPGR